jgi:hypothetical protein
VTVLIQEFMRHKVKFNAAAKLTCARKGASSQAAARLTGRKTASVAAIANLGKGHSGHVQAEKPEASKVH